MCGRVAVLAVRADEMFHRSARLAPGFLRAVYFGSPRKIRRGGRSFDYPHAGNVANRPTLTYPVIFDQSAKQCVVFRVAARSDVCEAHSRIDSEGGREYEGSQ